MKNIGKYQDALSALCGVDYPYMQGDPDVDAMIELIALAIEQEATIQQIEAKIGVMEKLLNKAEAKLEALQMDNEQLKSDIVNERMNLEKVQELYEERACLCEEQERTIMEREAEIERLRPFGTQVEVSKKIEAKIKNEARKEFWEALKEYMDLNDGIKVSDVDSFLKELDGDNNG